MKTEREPRIEIAAAVAPETPKLPDKHNVSTGHWWDFQRFGVRMQPTSNHYMGKKMSVSAAVKRLRRNKCAKQARKAHRYG